MRAKLKVMAMRRLQVISPVSELLSGWSAGRSQAAKKRRRNLGSAMCLGFIAAVSGCQTKQPWEITVPVAGSVAFNGQPIEGAQIMLYPVSSEVPTSVRPAAISDREGRFRISTYSQDDGAPAGEYTVAIVWHPLVNSGKGAVRGDNKLPSRYARPETSGVSTSVGVGGGTLPAFVLKK